MSTYVNSLRRLYQAGRITDVRLAELLESKTINDEEYQYIIGE